MHTRICTQVCKFLEMISKDEICCLLRPDLLLRWPGCSHFSLCHPSSPSAHLPSPPFLSASLCAPLFPITPCFSPLPCLCCPSSFHHCALWFSLSLGQELRNFFLFLSVKIQIEKICRLFVLYYLCCSYSPLLL